MPYATLTDLTERFGEVELIQLTDRTNPRPTTIDADVVDRALADATALVDGYVAKLYAVPLSPVPGNLVKVTSDIARFYLHGKPGKDDAVTRAYADALRWLQDVSRGLVQLEAGGVTPPAGPGGAGRVSGSEPVFTREKLRGF